MLKSKLLSNKYVLYFLLLLSITHVLGYIETNNFDALALFMASLVIMTYFSKNMTVNLLIALIATNVVFASKKVYEGMRSKKRSKKGRQSRRRQSRR